MDCRRAEELLSDHAEGILEEPLRTELVSHLRTCPACQELARLVTEVRTGLGAYPVPEPRAELASRLALLRNRALGRRWGLPPRIQVAAAILTCVSTAGLLWAASAYPTSKKTAHRLWERGSSAQAWVVERKERLMEDLHLVRVLVGAALEGRLDRVTEGVTDYRKTLEKRQGGDGGQPRRTP